MSPAHPRNLIAAVQTNCHIADATQAGELPLCIYLLQMREFYRWEQGLPFGAALPRDQVGAWIATREALWDGLEGRALAPLPLPTTVITTASDTYAVDEVNAVLASHGLAYGAGLVGPGRPSFFVAELLRQDTLRVDGAELLVQTCGTELARGLTSPIAMLAPAANANATPHIVLRQAALARWLWERFESHSLHPGAGPLLALSQRYGLLSVDAFNTALPRMVQDMGRMLVLHELGEWRAGQQLGPAWPALRQAQAGNRRAELRLRAVRDLLADLGTTLPALLDPHDDAGLQFWLASFEGHREALFPGLKRAGTAWQQGDGGRALRQAIAAGLSHFQALAQRLLDVHQAHADPLQTAPAVALLLDETTATCTI